MTDNLKLPNFIYKTVNFLAIASLLFVQYPIATAQAQTATILGNSAVGGSTDSNDSNTMNGSKYTMTENGTASSISVYVGSVAASPNNQFQLAIYADNNGQPGSLIAQTASGTLTANSWNTLPISANLVANSSYWLMYNTNGNSSSVNDLKYSAGTTNQSAYKAQTFGTWPASFGTATNENSNFSLYVTYTAGADTTAPVISNVATSNIQSTSATVSWTTDELSDSQVEYGLDTTYGSSTTLNTTMVTSHSVALSGLTASTTYHYRVKSKDAAGNLATGTDNTFTTSAVDTTAPVISSINAGNISTTGATITWNTDEPADSQVEYGLDTTYGSSTTLNTALVTSHSVTVSGLTANTTYHFRVKSKDSSGNLATSLDNNFTTAASNSAVIGQFEPLMSWPLVAVHANLLPTGKVLMWDAWETYTSNTRVWDPATNTFTLLPVSSGLFCAGQATTPDGHILVMGGFADSEVGIKDVWDFNPFNNTWTKKANMTYARWYPSVNTLPDGRILTLSGQTSPNVYANTPEIYDGTANTTSTLSSVSTTELKEDQYPFTSVLPSGKVLSVSAEYGSEMLLDVNSQSWTNLGTMQVPWGTPVSFAPGKYLWTGGGVWEGNSVNKASVLDLTSGSPVWTDTQSMHHARSFHNAVMLPTGKALAIGGSPTVADYSGTGTLTMEMWDPNTGSWTDMATPAVPRMYHSTDILLPDGRVLTAGGGRLSGAPDELNAQVYDPPYLFQGARPTISSGPTSVSYGSTMDLQSPDASNITKVTMVNLQAETHFTDGNQHFMELPFTTSGNTLTVSTPANSNYAPPGYYMVFIINSAGVPSVAQIVQISGSSPADTQAPTVNLTSPQNTATVSGTINVTADATDNVGVAGVQFKLDGNNLGTEVTTAPYSTSWNTTSVADGTHSLTAVARDAAGNSSTSAAVSVTVSNTVPDTTPPVISNVASSNITTSGATITWTTDEPADSQVEYGLDTNYGSSTTLNTALVTSHSVGLTGLAASATYHYRVDSKDASGNLATGVDNTFTTQTLDTTPPVISAVSSSNISSSGATISWTTDEPSDSQVEYGLDINYGSTTTLNTTLVTSHSQSLTNLAANTTYHFRVKSKDSSGNLATSGDSTFTTLAAPTLFSLWSDSAVPGGFDNSDTSSLELGVKFQSSQAGYIKGIRFYKSAQSTGTYTGSLWKSSGTKLASKVYSNVTSSGWQTVLFDTPVAITANTIYVASTHLSAGRYAQDVNYFSSALTSGPLTALKNGTSGGNGVYKYGSSVVFPNQTYSASNYWVDVVFSTTP